MDLRKACTFYLTYSNQLKNPERMLNEIRNSHKLLQSKRRKLRTGAITFAFKRFYYGEFLISQ